MPYLAEGGEAKTILVTLADASKQLGIKIRIEGDSAILVLGDK